MRDDKLYRIMKNSLDDKCKLIPYIVGKNVLDVGCADGSFMKCIKEYIPNIRIYGIDASDESCKRKLHRLDIRNCYSDELEIHFKQQSINTIIASSVLHEIFSYGNRDGSKGKLKNISNFLNSSHKILKSGGRLLIRDGVNPGNEVDYLEINDDNAVSKFLKHSPFSNNKFDRQILINKIQNGLYRGTRSSLMEFAYTYTWGETSFEREVCEFYGVFTLDEMQNFVERHGFKCLNKESYLQKGYVDHLPNVKFGKGFPDSNALWIFEKI